MLPDDISFAIVIELKDDKAPSVTHGKDPPPWVPATVQHTTTGTSEQAELHMLRAVETGIINVRYLQGFSCFTCMLTS